MHKRGQIGLQKATRPVRASDRCSGGGGNRTRVAARQERMSQEEDPDLLGEWLSEFSAEAASQAGLREKSER